MQVYLGQLMLVPYNFVPTGFALCAGQLLPISANTALFSLLGTTYGGNGINTFALPDLRGRIPIGAGQGPGLQYYDLGQMEGTEAETLTRQQNAAHNHSVQAAEGRGTTPVPQPAGNVLVGLNANNFAPGNSPANQPLSANAIQSAGNGHPHSNLMPYLTLNWIIALTGIYPPRS